MKTLLNRVASLTGSHARPQTIAVPRLSINRSALDLHGAHCYFTRSLISRLPRTLCGCGGCMCNERRFRSSPCPPYRFFRLCGGGPIIVHTFGGRGSPIVDSTIAG